MLSLGALAALGGYTSMYAGVKGRWWSSPWRNLTKEHPPDHETVPPHIGKIAVELLGIYVFAELLKGHSTSSGGSGVLGGLLGLAGKLLGKLKGAGGAAGEGEAAAAAVA